MDVIPYVEFVYVDKLLILDADNVPLDPVLIAGDLFIGLDLLFD